MLTLLSLALLAVSPVQSGDDSGQVHWQRSLDDALAQVERDGRPLLVVINADGESASERLVRERYRDPRWVAHTRAFHCVVGSYFRHTPRDHDAQGRRIPCPRLGEVTCGEHIALEPVLHERYLLGEHIVVDDGVVQRISPRHALVLADGAKAWDLFLLFDFATLDQRLAEWAAKWPAEDAAAWEPADADPRHRARLAREQRAAASAATPAGAAAWLDAAALRPRADRGLAEELRRVLPQLDASSERARTLLFDLAARSGASQDFAWALRERCVEAPSDAPRLLPALADLAWDDVGQRTFVVSHAVLADAPTAASARAAIVRRAGLSAGELDALGAGFDVLGHASARALAGVAPVRAEKGKPELPPSNELERALEAADDALSRDRQDAAAQLALGRAALTLARRRMQDGGPGVELLLEDAKRALAAAQPAAPNDVQLRLDRARVANYLSDFEEQERLALEALEARGVDLAGGPLDDDMTEAARWLGDAEARLLGERARGGVARAAHGMLLGALALKQAAFGPEHDATDWLSLASFYGALGRSRERVELAFAGLLQYPTSAALRGELASACWSLGRPELLVERSADLELRTPDWAECAWYSGYALVLQAEALRRGEEPDGALAAYDRAEECFLRALALEPGFRDSSEHYLGMCALGRGFAQLSAGRRELAARCAVEAARVRPQVVEARDGLDREALDLIDGVLEWRTTGASPVDALAWVGEFAAADPTNPFWPRAISDAELREGLRAFGRRADEAGFAYLDAALGAARAALALSPDEASRRAVAQVATVIAEALLARESADLQRAAGMLAEAAPLIGLDAPSLAGVERAELLALAARLRSELGAARPIFRPGR